MEYTDRDHGLYSLKAGLVISSLVGNLIIKQFTLTFSANYWLFKTEILREQNCPQTVQIGVLFFNK